jgi:hypothetical protein
MIATSRGVGIGPMGGPVLLAAMAAILGAAEGCGPASVSRGPAGGAGGGAAGAGGPTVPGVVLAPGSSGPGDGGVRCGPQVEGPPIPCPDAAAPPAAPPGLDGGSATPAPPTADCPSAGPITVKVRAWGATPTCVYLRAGESAEIAASGRWRSRGGREVGPEGAAPAEGGCNRGALVARVAKFHQRTCIGAGGRITAQRDGYLWLFQSGGWNAMESSGEITATISGGGRSAAPLEGLTPLGDDSRVDPARIAAFEKVCGREAIPVHFEAEEPDHPRVRAYVAEVYGGDPVGVISRNIVVGCALFYATPEEFPRAFRERRVRVVHYIASTRRWGELGRPELRNARGQHWDFDLTKTLAEITSMQPDYGPFGGPPVSIMHEVGHLIAPDGAGGKLPKWLAETYAESLPANLGGPMGFHHAIDNPESVRFGARDWWWCDGTFGGPTFLDFVDERHPGFIHFLTRQSLRIGEKNPWPGSDAVFRMFTGQSFDALWASYVDAYQFRSGKPVQECLDPQE